LTETFQPEGFINIIKEPGMTSHDVVASVRRHLPRRHKVGHLGTLDPDASGVLPLALGRATRLIQYAAVYEKIYVGEITLGITTDTLDIFGREIKREKAGHLSVADLLSVLPRFCGEYWQVPPMVSALKLKGQPLYKLARQGIEIDRTPRPVRIREITLLEADWQGEHPKATLRVVCGGGTYIRSLFDDIGKELGVGACLSSLRREAVGPFKLSAAFTLPEAEELLDRQDQSLILPKDFVLDWMPRICCDNRRLLNGLSVSCDAPLTEACRVYDEKGLFWGIGEICEKPEESSRTLRLYKVLVDANTLSPVENVGDSVEA